MLENTEHLDKLLEEGAIPTANIMVAGITGTGKSTLLNAVFGEDLAKTGQGKPITTDITEYKKEDMPVCVWDTMGLELDPERAEKSITDIKNAISQKSNSNDPFDRIHGIWYCINSGSRRYQGGELDFIRNLHSLGLPFMIVMTQCSGDVDEVKQFEKTINKINNEHGLDDIQVVQVLAKDYKIRGDFSIQAFGLDKLVDVTVEQIPDFVKSGFIAAQKASLSQKRSLCEDIIISVMEDSQEGFWDKVVIVNMFKANQRVKNMLFQIGRTYNNNIPETSIDYLLKHTSVSFSNLTDALWSITDWYSGYVQNIIDERKARGQGFRGDIKVNNKHRVACMVAFFGYTFIDSLEEVWNAYTEEELKNVDIIVNALIASINDKLSQRKSSSTQPRR